ncbi:hypothetical protein DX03_14820 [Stenotrophomonas rhizophila]|nr:hypothetical protein DX03_14820 [Stenotrophomonas rhizophila]
MASPFFFLLPAPGAMWIWWCLRSGVPRSEGLRSRRQAPGANVPRPRGGLLLYFAQGPTGGHGARRAVRSRKRGFSGAGRWVGRWVPMPLEAK